MHIREITKTFDVSRVVPYFQPIMDLEHQCVWRYECLARLISEDQHAFLPSDFLYLVERENQTEKFTESVFSQCLAYFQNTNVPWHVNLHAQDLLNTRTQDYLLECVSAYPRRNNINFEITAQIAVSHTDEVRRFVERCHLAGVGVYIDNIGSVPTNLSRLLEIPVEGIKVAGELTKQLSGDDQVADFIRHLCELADSHNMHVVAEHIEDEGVLASVTAMGFKYAQGYHFSYPCAQINQAS